MSMTTLWMCKNSPANWTHRLQQLRSIFRLGAVQSSGQQWHVPSYRLRYWTTRTQAGFSLVELLTVAGILTIAMAALMGTLTLALQTTRNNSALVEANNNVRAALTIIKNDLDNVGEMPGLAPYGLPGAYVRGGFLAARGFPQGSGSAPPDRIGNIQPRLIDGTFLNTTCDILSPIQAATSNAASTASGTFNSPPPILANQGYASLSGGSAASRYPNLQVYPGACDRTEVNTVYDRGSHQLITLQYDPIPVVLRVRVPDPTNPNQDIEQQQIFMVKEPTYIARAQLQGNNLILVPEEAGPNDPDFPAGTPHNLQPSRVAPNRVPANPFVNPRDRFLAPRLRPFLDTLLLRYEYSRSNTITSLSVLGLVTGVDRTNNHIILAGNDLAGINPDWSGIIQNNTLVRVARMRLSHYFVGWERNNSPPALYCRQGGFLFPVAIDIENLRLRFTLVDEDLVSSTSDGNEPVQGIMFTTDDIGGPINSPPGAPPGAIPSGPRNPLTTKIQVRMVEVTVYGRTGERERALIARDQAIPHPINRGYFHVSERTTVGLRNLVPRNTLAQ